MSYASKILADSVSPGGDRVTTFEITFPRMVLPEFNTHRVFSRNSASSRAIPVIKQLRFVLEDPFVPSKFGENQPGMQASRNLSGAKEEAARQQWLTARDDAVDNVISLLTSREFGPADGGVQARFEALAVALENKETSDEWLNVHKQLTNRLLEPFMWHTVIVTATEWDNFWHLRTHADAQPEIREIACRMKEQLESAVPTARAEDEWHLPLTDDLGSEVPIEKALRISVGRCARVSYLTHSGVRDHDADVTLHDRLLESGHLSPFEHQAQPVAGGEWSANFKGWRAYRKSIPGESDFLGLAEAPAALAA